MLLTLASRRAFSPGRQVRAPVTASKCWRRRLRPDSITTRISADRQLGGSNSRSACALSGTNCLLRTLGEQPVVDDAGQGGANNWGYPEQPQLSQCPPP